MHLQASVEGYDSFARSLTIGAETMVMKFRPELPMHDRYAVSHDFLPPSAGRRGAGDLEADQRVLPMGVQLLRVAGRRRRGPPHRLRQRLSGHRDHLAALLLPVGDLGTAEVVGVLRGHRPAAAAGHEHPGVLRRRPTRTCPTRTSWRRTRRSPTSTSRRTGTRSSARRRWRRWTRSSGTGSPRRSSTRCWSTRSAATYPATSRTASSPTSAGCWVSGSRTTRISSTGCARALTVL